MLRIIPVSGRTAVRFAAREPKKHLRMLLPEGGGVSPALLALMNNLSE